MRISHHRRQMGGRGNRRGGGRAPAIAPWSPLDYAGLRHLYEGDDVTLNATKIATWVDKDGVADATQPSATDALRPVYSASIASLGNRPGGVFSAASQHWLRSPAVTAITQPYTVVAAFSLSSIGILQAFCGGSLGARWSIRVNNSTNAIEFFSGATFATTSVIATTATSYRGIFVFNGTSSKARINGASVYAGATAIGTNAIGDVTIGREATADHWDGSLAHLGVISGDLIADATNLALYESYLSRFA